MAGKHLQLEDQFCVLSMNGVVASDVYVLKRLPDPKLIAVLEAADGKTHRVHQERLVPVDSYGKAIVVNKVLKTVCPKCRHLVDITPDNHVDCSCQPQRIPVLSVDTTRSSFSNEKDDIMAAQATIDKVDLAQIAAYGIELWAKGLAFDHAHVDTVGYTLLNDGPPRKLCFQTYKGSLGKKANGLARLNLAAFQSNQLDGKGKAVGYAIKGTLDDERKRLTKEGYSLVEITSRSEEQDVSAVTQEE